MGEYKFQILHDECRTPGVKVFRDGVHFGYFASSAERPYLLLYEKGSEEIAAQLPFPEAALPGNFYTMKVKLPADAYEYNYLDGDRVVTDIYAPLIAGRREYGKIPSSAHALRGAFVTGKYRWGEDALPKLSFSDVVMYHLHVRGFTKHKNSGVSETQKGTFAGLKRKIPYLKSLGVNMVKLMPIYDFSELEIPEHFFARKISDTRRSVRVDNGADKPKSVKAQLSVETEQFVKSNKAVEPEQSVKSDKAVKPEKSAKPDRSLKADKSAELTSALSVSQAEVLAHAFDPPAGVKQEFRKNYWGYGPGFYFAPKASYAASERPDIEFRDLVKAFHANGIEVVPEFSFAPDADMSLICACLQYWAEEYHVDGFAIVGRDGLYGELAKLPLFADRKLICGWYPDGIAGENAKKMHHQIAQSNDGFMNDCRRLLKGDAGMLESFSWRTRQNPKGCAQINYMSNHDGFTLLDLVSYNMKYNDANGEMGRDGAAENYSWNCGEEGPCGKRKITDLRMRQRKNAFAMMLLSQGTPMLLAGDEFGNTQQGNNNPWCHDSELTWLDWSRTKANRELTRFVGELVAYRKAHPALHQKEEPRCSDYLATGFPDLSFHGDRAWYGDLRQSSLHLGCMYSGKYEGEEGFLYIAWNFHWEEQQLALPLLPEGSAWYRVMDTSLPESFLPEEEQEKFEKVRTFAVSPRSVVILEGK